MKFMIIEGSRVMVYRIFYLLIGLLLTMGCSTDLTENSSLKKIKSEITNKLNNEYFYLLKDANGIPNSNGLVLMHSKKDSLLVHPKLVTNLDFTPVWERTTFPIEFLNCQIVLFIQTDNNITTSASIQKITCLWYSSFLN